MLVEPKGERTGHWRAGWAGGTVELATLTPEKIKASVACEWKLQENEYNLLEL